MPRDLNVKLVLVFIVWFMLYSRHPLESGLIFPEQQLVTTIGFHVRAFSELIVLSYYFHCKSTIF